MSISKQRIRQQYNNSGDWTTSLRQWMNHRTEISGKALAAKGERPDGSNSHKQNVSPKSELTHSFLQHVWNILQDKSYIRPQKES